MVDGDGLENRCAKAPGVRIPLSPPDFLRFSSALAALWLFNIEHGIFFGLEKYPRGRRGSPAKGVDVSKACEGSNPSFSAKRTNPATIVVAGFFLYMRYAAIPTQFRQRVLQRVQQL